jgi:hypothetical protein
MSNICPVCGFPGLKKPAYRMEILGSFEICPSCSFQFGFTDDDRGITHEQWRKQWIDGGMVWDKGSSRSPEDWDPKKQLLNVTDSKG